MFWPFLSAVHRTLGSCRTPRPRCSSYSMKVVKKVQQHHLHTVFRVTLELLWCSLIQNSLTNESDQVSFSKRTMPLWSLRSFKAGCSAWVLAACSVRTPCSLFCCYYPVRMSAGSLDHSGFRKSVNLSLSAAALSLPFSFFFFYPIFSVGETVATSSPQYGEEQRMVCHELFASRVKVPSPFPVSPPLLRRRRLWINTTLVPS